MTHKTSYITLPWILTCLPSIVFIHLSGCLQISIKDFSSRVFVFSVSYLISVCTLASSENSLPSIMSKILSTSTKFHGLDTVKCTQTAHYYLWYSNIIPVAKEAIFSKYDCIFKNCTCALTFFNNVKCIEINHSQYFINGLLFNILTGKISSRLCAIQNYRLNIHVNARSAM